MSRTLASWSSGLQKQTGRGRRLVTTTCISEANSQEVVTQPTTWKEWVDCPTHLAEASTTLRDVSPFGDLPTNRWENDGGRKTSFLPTVRTVRLYRRKLFRYEVPKETFQVMLTIRYLAMVEGGGDADLSLVTPCRSFKMHTNHLIYQ